MPSSLWKTLRLTALPLACLLAASPAPAAPQPPPLVSINSAQTAKYSPHILHLKHISPDKLLVKMGWTSTLSPVNGSNTSTLPLGVDRIYAIEGDNSLIVFSTVEGFNLVREIVTPLDVMPRKSTINVSFVTACAADVNALGINPDPLPLAKNPHIGPAGNETSAAGQSPSLFVYVNVAAQLYDMLLKKKQTKVLGTAVLDVINNSSVSLNVDALLRTDAPRHNKDDTEKVNVPPSTDRIMSILPRINGDDSVTMALSLGSISTTRTIRIGDVMAVAYAKAHTNRENPGTDDIVSLVFLCPTPTNTDNAPKAQPLP